MNQHEHNLQVACVRWFRMQYPKYARLLFAIPNGGKRHMKTAIAMKAEGAQKGVPDLMLALPHRPSSGEFFRSGLFIEMKSATGRLSPEQKEYLVLLASAGYQVAVCNSFDQFKATIEDYLR